MAGRVTNRGKPERRQGCLIEARGAIEFADADGDVVDRVNDIPAHIRRDGPKDQTSDVQLHMGNLSDFSDVQLHIASFTRFAMPPGMTSAPSRRRA